MHCISDCVLNVLNGNIPVSEEEKERLRRYRKSLRESVKKKTSDEKRKHLIQEGGFLGALIPILAGLLDELFG